MIYEVRELSYRYPATQRVILDQVSLELDEGEVLSILGPNGAGKSTLLNCMAGLMRPEHGFITLNGRRLERMSGREIAREVGYVQQVHNPAFPYTVFEYVLMGRGPKVGFFSRPGPADEEVVWRALSMLELTHLAHRPYTNISGGERQQCIIARAVVQEPRAILFDEPTASLDYGNQARVLRLVRRMADQGFSVVMTTHNPDHALLLGGRTAVLDRQGRLVCGPTEMIMTTERLRTIYHTDLLLEYVPSLDRVACMQAKL